MKKPIHLLIPLVISAACFLVTGCSTDPVTGARQSGVERRQNRIDSRTYARQERWNERGEREDARARARFDSW